MWWPKRAEPNRGRKRLLQFLFAFVCVFAGLTLPSPGLGPLYVRLHTALASAMVSDTNLSSGVELSMADTSRENKEPWQSTLVVQPPRPASPVLVPIDFRGLMFLPTAAFIALAVAAPLGAARRNLLVLAIGLPILEALLLALMCVPMLSFLGGTGPVKAFELSKGAHAVLQVVYRALVAPPGMMFALPLFLWWILVNKVGGFQEAAGSLPTAQPLATPRVPD